MPIASFATHEIYKFALKSSEDKALAIVDKAALEDGQSAGRSRPWWKLGEMKDKAESFIAAIGASVRQLAQLIASYVLQAILLPVAFIFLFLFLARAACDRLLAIGVNQKPAGIAVAR